MNTAEIVEFVSSLIAIPSPSGREEEAVQFLEADFRRRGWNCEVLPVEGERKNLFVSFGEPRVCFTTHVDIVAAPERLFQPEVRGGKLFGRGACDAKGIIGCMVAAAERLLAAGESGLSLLFVVGEEHDGIGAIAASKQLAGRGIRYIVDGEPTEGKLMAAHKGGLTLSVEYRGRSCHSGYPHLGDDANAKLIRFMHEALSADFGEDSTLGRATFNLGRIQGGTGDNIVSNYARVSGIVRTVTDNEPVLAKIRKLAGPEAKVEVSNAASLVRLKTVPGFEIDIASYCTDIAHFAPLGAECLLYGPGTIRLAHTDEEHITLEDLETAVDGFCRIFAALRA